MKESARIVDRIRKLLTSKSLGSGPIRLVNRGYVEVGSVRLQVFAVNVESLSFKVNELILLAEETSNYLEAVPVADRASLQPFKQIAADHDAGRVWLVLPQSNERAGVVGRDLEDYILSVTGTRELFKEILPLPESFWRVLVSDVTPEDFFFEKAFRRRAATSTRIRPGVARFENVASLDEELRRWADSTGEERPILLLGDRGSGKTWQLIKFCEEQYKRSQVAPWSSPPAIYLSLRHQAGYLARMKQSPLSLLTFLTDLHPWLRVKWEMSMFEALLVSGQLIFCLDGLDEVEVQATDSGVRDHLHRILSMLPYGSRFIISSRATHFSSFDDIYSLGTWPGKNVASSFRVLQLSSLNSADVMEYTNLLLAREPSGGGEGSLRELLCGNDDQEPLITALRRCCQQPAILARVVRDARETPLLSPFLLLQSAIESAYIQFNVQFERTNPWHDDVKGIERTFDTPARIAFLGELAWFLTERRLNSIDLDHLPARLVKMFGIDTESLQRDVRSQTVFELVEAISPPARTLMNSTISAKSGASSIVRFGLRVDADSVKWRDQPRPLMKTLDRSERAAHLGQENIPSASVSVSESYFLASHISARLADSENLPGLDLEDTLHFLGRVPIDDLTGAILREMLAARKKQADWAGKIVRGAVYLVRDLARRGGCSVFARPLRYLFQNLEMLGYITSEQRTAIDPWVPSLSSLLKCPGALGDYEFILVPAPSSAKLASLAMESGIVSESTKPFLMGIHEITNDQFERFILSPAGKEWAVDRITRAASGGVSPSSQFASLTTEYHLYFWKEQSHQPGVFGPPIELLRHPVVYVSWYLAQAYCNWLSEEDWRPIVCSLNGTSRTSRIESHLDAPGFRLPTAVEWWWSSQGHSERIKFPWELIPYPVDLPIESVGPCDSDSAKAIEWFKQYRDAAYQVLLDPSRQSSEVAFDDDVGPFGAIGLIGNVKEWVQDIVDDPEPGVQKAIVCGTTAHLGESSFQIGYYASLFPENSNPDLGFRIARSLSSEECESFQHRELELASLSDVETASIFTNLNEASE